MATTMRKIGRLAATGRAAASFSTSRRQLSLQTPLYSSRNITCSYASPSHWFSSLDKVTGGQNYAVWKVCYSSTASAAQELHEKDLQQSNRNYVPNDVVLYQYQACPFCNKVKGDGDPPVLCLVTYYDGLLFKKNYAFVTNQWQYFEI